MDIQRRDWLRVDDDRLLSAYWTSIPIPTIFGSKRSVPSFSVVKSAVNFMRYLYFRQRGKVIKPDKFSDKVILNLIRYHLAGKRLLWPTCPIVVILLWCSAHTVDTRYEDKSIITFLLPSHKNWASRRDATCIPAGT